MSGRRRPNAIIEDGDTVWIVLRRHDGTERTRTAIDRSDYAHVRDRIWCLSGNYATSNRRTGSGRGHGSDYLHKFLIQAGAEVEVDHMDGDRLNNRRSNLRVVSHAENQQNHAGRIGREYLRNVRFDKRRGTYSVVVSCSMTGFKTETEAREAAKNLREMVFTHHVEARHDHPARTERGQRGRSPASRPMSSPRPSDPGDAKVGQD